MAPRLVMLFAMLSIAGSLNIEVPTDPVDLDRWQSEMKKTGQFFNGQSVAVGRVSASSTSGNESYMMIGHMRSPVYSVSDEPFRFAKYDSSQVDEIKDGDTSKCTPAEREKLAKKYPVQDIPQAAVKSALPAGSYYATHASLKEQMGCAGTVCKVPHYLPARVAAAEHQKIPRILWMTIPNKMASSGPYQFNLLAEHFMGNPEYEFVASNDDQSAAFMASNEVKPAWAAAYKRARNGAEKADLWRYAVMYKYGGVYMDSDMKASKPLRGLVDSSADVVMQVTSKNHGQAELSQFTLLLAPNNKLMEATLDDIAARMLTPGAASETTISLSGPGALARVWTRNPEFGLTDCANGGSSKGPHHVCGKPKSTESGKFGKVLFLTGGRDLNTGTKWHKADVCALAECRSSIARWEASSVAAGGKGKAK